MIKSDIKLKILFYEIFVFGSAYIVGGFFRDFLNNRKSRDVDVIVDISSSKLLNIVAECGNPYSINRHGGIKIQFASIQIDIWSIQDNWAFKNNLVKLNEEDKLNSIAKGCFYNFDSLVINLHNFSYNLRHYNEFINSQKLDILQNSPTYKNLNPTTEANILRAFYIKNRYNCKYTINTYKYLLKKVGSLDDKKSDNAFDRLIVTRGKYIKYQELNDNLIIKYLKELKSKDNPSNQIPLDL
tara:strand:+ start:5440 stop:6162 length:723 start_codon:yes stop_codon:yes gene_type:complete